MSIATRTGDTGTTGLLHGQRVPKDHPQIEALGAFDELNVEVGGAGLAAEDPAVRDFLRSIQTCLVGVMGEVSCAKEDAAAYCQSAFAHIAEADLKRLDDRLAALEAKGVAAEGGPPRAGIRGRSPSTAPALPPDGPSAGWPAWPGRPIGPAPPASVDEPAFGPSLAHGPRGGIRAEIAGRFPAVTTGNEPLPR